MKKFFVLLVAIALSTMLYAAKGEQGSSHGQPFLTLQGQIDKLVGDADTIEDRLDGLESATAKLEQDVKALYIGLEGVMEDYVFPNAEAIGDNAEAILKLQDAIDGNSLLIEAMGNEIEWINEELAIKQNIIEGTCPPGQALVAVNTDENDAVMICEAVSGSGGLQQTVIAKTASIGRYQVDSILATCPVGTVATGGGFKVGQEMSIYASRPQNNGWLVHVKNTSRYPRLIGVEVVCLKLQ